MYGGGVRSGVKGYNALCARPAACNITRFLARSSCQVPRNDAESRSVNDVAKTRGLTSASSRSRVSARDASECVRRECACARADWRRTVHETDTRACLLCSITEYIYLPRVLLLGARLSFAVVVVRILFRRFQVSSRSLWFCSSLAAA